MPDQELVSLMSTLARLTNPRSPVPRVKALATAHRRLRGYALRHRKSEEWCDHVFLLFFDRSHGVFAAA